MKAGKPPTPIAGAKTPLTAMKEEAMADPTSAA